MCKGCTELCTSDVTHVCDQTCSDCMASLRAGSTTFESPSTTAIGNLEVVRVSRSTSRAPQRKCLYVNVSDDARRVDGSWRKEITNAINDSARTISRTGRWFTCAIWDRLRTRYPPQVIRYYTCSMILWLPKILGIWTRPSYTYLNLYVCSSSVLGARTWKTEEETACDAVSGSPRSGTIMLETC